MSIRGLLIVAVLPWVAGCVLSGCAPVHPRAASAAHVPRLPGIECRQERVTGSLIATRICTLGEQREAREKSAQDMRDFLDRQVIAACPGTPGCRN